MNIGDNVRVNYGDESSMIGSNENLEISYKNNHITLNNSMVIDGNTIFENDIEYLENSINEEIIDNVESNFFNIGDNSDKNYDTGMLLQVQYSNIDNIGEEITVTNGSIYPYLEFPIKNRFYISDNMNISLNQVFNIKNVSNKEEYIMNNIFKVNNIGE